MSIPLTAQEFSEQLLDIDQYPDTFFVQHNRPEYQFPLHQHQKGQFLYVEAGLAFLITPQSSYFLPARHYVWVPPAMAHYPLLRTPRSLLHSLCFPVAPTAAVFYRRMGIYPLTSLLHEMLHFTADWQGHIGPDQAVPYAFLTALQAILPACSPHALPLALPTTTDGRLQPLLAYVHQHLAEPLVLAELAQRFGYSERTLAREFRRRLQLSFLQYLKIRRITAAMELMLQAPLSMSEIAYRVGYQSLAAFSTTFLQLVHCRPSEFARRMQAGAGPAA